MPEDGPDVPALDLQPHALGTVLLVKARPGMRGDEVRGVHAGMLKLSVRAVAEQGQANRAIVELLAEVLGVAKHRVELLSGAASGQKRFVVHGLTPVEVLARVSARLGV
jgi:uncharacterized protein